MGMGNSGGEETSAKLNKIMMELPLIKRNSKIVDSYNRRIYTCKTFQEPVGLILTIIAGDGVALSACGTSTITAAANYATMTAGNDDADDISSFNLIPLSDWWRSWCK